jgi:hypothetical protein
LNVQGSGKGIFYFLFFKPHDGGCKENRLSRRCASHLDSIPSQKSFWGRKDKDTTEYQPSFDQSDYHKPKKIKQKHCISFDPSPYAMLSSKS